MFTPQPPAGAPKNSVRPKSAGAIPNISPAVAEILKTVTPNYVMTAVIKNRLEEGAIKAQRKKRKTRAQILATMDLRELQMERLAMARMGFFDKAKEVEQWIERERTSLQAEREEKEQAILAQKLGSLDMGHRRRMVGLETRLSQELNSFTNKCKKEMEDTKDKHRREYEMLIEETAQRAYGGVSSCQCRKKYLCRHNKTASYNTRKPTRDVISLRQNAERLRATGRVEEGEEFERQAQVLDDRADKNWRTRVEQSIVSSAWSGGKSRLEQMVERQQHCLKSLEETHEAKLELVKKQQEIQRRNLRSTFQAERKKVTMYCRRAALKRMTRDIKEDADEQRRVMAQKSDGMQNVSRNMLKDDEYDSSSDESGDEGQIDWIAPTASGIENSKAIANYDDLKTGKIYEELDEMKKRGIQVQQGVATYTAVEAIIGDKTSGSRLNDAFRIAREANATETANNAAAGAWTPPSAPGLGNTAAWAPPSQPGLGNVPKWTPPSAPGLGSTAAWAPPSQAGLGNVPKWTPPSAPGLANTAAWSPPSAPGLGNANANPTPAWAPPSQPGLSNTAAWAPPSAGNAGPTPAWGPPPTSRIPSGGFVAPSGGFGAPPGGFGAPMNTNIPTFTAVPTTWTPPPMNNANNMNSVPNGGALGPPMSIGVSIKTPVPPTTQKVIPATSNKAPVSVASDDEGDDEEEEEEEEEEGEEGDY